MTSGQYKTYQRVSQEIRQVNDFLERGCGLTRNKFTSKFPFRLLVRERHEKKMFFRRCWHACGQSENEFEIPKSLQLELAATAEQWLRRNEDFLRNI